MARTFVSSRSNPATSSSPIGATTGAVTGAVVASSPMNMHADPKGFLGLNWKSIGISVFVAVVTAVATDVALSEWHEYRRRKKEKGLE